MASDHRLVRAFHQRLIALYPAGFKEQLGESMQQTFNDLLNEKLQTGRPLTVFILRTFIETAMGIFREHLLLISCGGIMQSILKTLGSSTLISLLFIVPFAIMEIVNRRKFNEDFPFALFFALWLNFFAISQILLPVIRAWRAAKRQVIDPMPTQSNAPLTNPWRSAMISIALIVSPGIFPLLDSMGWLSVDQLFNRPSPEVAYLPGLFLGIILIFFPIIGGMVAGQPVIRRLQAGGRLYAYPIHLIIVVVLSLLFAAGVTSLIVDQWPCFVGVPLCD